MNFEEELRRSVDALADRLRDEVARHLEAAAGDLQATVHAERKAAGVEAARVATETAEREAAERLTAAVAEAEARAHEAGRAEGRAEGLEDGRAEGREAGLADGRAEGREAGFADGQAEGREAGFDDGRAEGREAGFAEGRAMGLEEGRAESRDGGKGALERLAEAIRNMDGARSLSEILDVLAGAAAREAARIGVLIVRDEQLQSWKFRGFGPALDEASQFAMPLSDGGLIAEAVRSAATASADSMDQASQPGFASIPSGRMMLAVPMTMSGQVVAVLYGDQGEGEDTGSAWPAALEMLTRHAARSLEALTAFRAAKLLAGTAGPEGVVPEVADDPQAARRYARLLISEIKLYHENDVIRGRQERDLATRLGGEIARARMLYEQRVPMHVRRADDHFHAELVSTLANGDPALLGGPF